MKIFLSAVSKQFKSCRDQLASDLRAVGATVKVQEDFTQHDGTLIAKLEKYISECDRVIALVGDAYGEEPPPAALPAGAPRRSYTQWEYFFARGERLAGTKPASCELFIYFATPEFLAQFPVTQTPDIVPLQEAFISSIRASGRDRGSFGSLHELRAVVLRDGFELRERIAPPQNLPYASIGTLFKGREQFLADLRRTLERRGDGHATAIVGKAVHGLGGVGKTRLAVEYAWQHLTDYSALLFVVADSPENLRRNLAALVGPLVLNLPEQSATEEDVRVAAALRWLAEHPGWFLILDNADTKEAAAAVQDCLARLTGGHVLITSRLSNWSAAVEPLELDVLDQADAATFLLARTEGRRRSTATDAADAAALAHELDGLALGLEQAGAYVAQRRCSLSDYLKEWQAHARQVLEWFDPHLMQYPRSVAVTWDTTLRQLGLGEIALLRMCAWLAPEPVPQFLFEAGVIEQPWRRACAALAAEAGTADAPVGSVEDALVNLVAFSMCKVSGDGYAVHRVVQDILRQRVPAPRRREWIELALRWVDNGATGDPGDVRVWPLWNPLAPHLAAVIGHADCEHIAEPTARLMSQLAQLLDAKALHREAEPLMRRALAIGEQSYGPAHPKVAIRLNNLAQLLYDTSRLAEAEPLMRRALAIDEQSYGPAHPKVATRLNNLAQLLQATNRLAEAEPLMRRALAVDEQSYGPGHPDVARDRGNLAYLLQATNRLGEAEPLMRRALAIDEQIYGQEHPEVARDLNNLAQLLQATSRLAEAEPLMRRALAIDEQSYGPEHPKVATRLNNLAQLLHDTRRLAEAEPLMRRALAIDEQSYGPEHPKVATRLNNLAQLLHDTSRLAEAEPLMRRALAIDEQIYGQEHPKVARDLNNLAGLLQATNRLAEAEPLMRRALVIDEQSYGQEHPEVARDLNNLAQLLQATNRLGEAEPLMRRALIIDEQSYGPAHPKVAIRLNNLAQLLRATNRLAEAEPLMRRALAIDEQSYGTEHPKVARDLNNLAGLLQDTNRLAEAEPLMRRHLVIFLRFTVGTGHEHPHLRAATANYSRMLAAMGLDAAAIEQRLAEVRSEAAKRPSES